jgi:hypothetical protein
VKLHVKKPSRMDIVGSYLLRTCTQPTLNVNVTATVPRSCLQVPPRPTDPRSHLCRRRTTRTTAGWTSVRCTWTPCEPTSRPRSNNTEATYTQRAQHTHATHTHTRNTHAHAQHTHTHTHTHTRTHTHARARAGRQAGVRGGGLPRRRPQARSRVHRAAGPATHSLPPSSSSPLG